MADDSISNQEKIFQYLQEYNRGLSLRSKAFLYAADGNANPKRKIFYKLKNYIENFLGGDSSLRNFILLGLRGTGKTTLLYQLNDEKFSTNKQFKKLFLSVDHVTGFLDSSIFDILHSYEKLMGMQFEELQEPLVIFLDEIQYDKKWDLVLKTIYERTNKVCIVATGSSAISLATSPDLARRAVFQEVLPLSFTEYLEINNGFKFDEQISQEFRAALIDSNSAKELFNTLQKYKTEVKEFFLETTQFEIDRYLNFGSLPFTLSIKDPGIIYSQIKTLIDRIVEIDLRQLDLFSQEIRTKVPALLYTIADSDHMSLRKMAEFLDISHPTLSDLLETLCEAKIIQRIYPYGSHGRQVKKSSKYLFSSPAFRAMYFNFVANIKGDYIGRILEDTVAMYFTRILKDRIDSSVTYDSSENSADFIIGLANDFILCEIGSGTKSFRQLNQTLKKIPQAKYGLNISKSIGVGGLALSKEEKFLQLPLEYLLLS